MRQMSISWILESSAPKSQEDQFALRISKLRVLSLCLTGVSSKKVVISQKLAAISKLKVGISSERMFQRRKLFALTRILFVSKMLKMKLLKLLKTLAQRQPRS